MTTPQSPDSDQPDAVAKPTTVELFASVRPIYAAAFARAALGEHITWEIAGVSMVNTDQGPQTRIMVYFHIPTPHPLGSQLQRLMLIQIGIPREAIEQEVLSQVEDLKQLRTKMLMETNGILPGQSGPNRLILPN
jgi:hypothetical protein